MWESAFWADWFWPEWPSDVIDRVLFDLAVPVTTDWTFRKGVRVCYWRWTEVT